MTYGLIEILKERNQDETIEFCIDTDFFGFGSLQELQKAHNNNYNKQKEV
jgi:hypothetical protein